MKLAISNIAWHAFEDAAIRQLMGELGATGLEIAPTRVWPDPLSAGAREIARFRADWERAGIRIVALQALLFGRDDLVLFKDRAKLQETRDYLVALTRLAGALGAEILVFGSPRNRIRGRLSPEEARRIAVPFFREVAEAAAASDACLCVEPNPAAYGCDFVTTAAEGLELVAEVAHPGFGLHLDAAGMTLAGDVTAGTRPLIPMPRHFHASDPQLGQLGTGGVDHPSLGSGLKAIGYQGWRSIEMRAQRTDGCVASVRAALEVAIAAYA